MLTTLGSPIYKDRVPESDDLIVERMRNAGAVMIGKTNTPEFGAGSQTFNEVFGVTSNPYNTDMTCGGSSGGAAVALAARMLPLADGSDLGGSLRNPASFCNVVGFRPSGGRVPTVPNSNLWLPMSTKGPMARSVADIALLMQAIAGPHQLAPSSNTEPRKSSAVRSREIFLVQGWRGPLILEVCRRPAGQSSTQVRFQTFLLT